MARFTRIQVATKMNETGIIPVFFNPDSEVCKKVIKACYDGGIRVIELTNRGDFAHEIFRDMSKYVTKELPEMILGAGTIVDSGTCSLYIQMGANFIVSPYLKEDIALSCNRRKILWAPGCGNLNDISRAEELGAEIVKIFPGSAVGGPKFVEAVKAPCPWTNIMPTGGVEPTEENLGAWFKAGVWCVGMGSQLITKESLANNNFAAITKKCADALEIVKKVRPKI